MARALPEWVGRSDDAKVPDRVRLRIFERDGGKCWISGRRIMPGERWELDHKVALINGGEHRESNLAPALYKPHREKTRQDVAEKAESARIRKKHLGIRPEPSLRGAGFPQRQKQRRATTPPAPKFEGDIMARRPT